LNLNGSDQRKQHRNREGGRSAKNVGKNDARIFQRRRYDGAD